MRDFCKNNKRLNTKLTGIKAKKNLLILISILILLLLISLAVASWAIILPFRSSAIIKPIGDFKTESIIKVTLAKNQLKIKSLVSNDNDIIIVISNNLKIYLSKQKNLEKQLTSLQLILNQFRIENKLLKKIDLRFKNVIIE